VGVQERDDSRMGAQEHRAERCKSAREWSSWRVCEGSWDIRIGRYIKSAVKFPPGG
jgi:hypothetical protein